jgi:hypothetical protein
MIPAGYMYKRIAPRPEWLNCGNVTKIYSVSGCISKDFTNYIPYWKHNKYWFFNTPEDMDMILGEEKLSDELELLFYEVYEKQFEAEEYVWQEFQGEETFGLQVKLPLQKVFLGFDIVSYSVGTSHECSPISCNLLCQEVPVNRSCLLEDFNFTLHLTETLHRKKCDPGPYRIIAVHKIDKTT